MVSVLRFSAGLLALLAMGRGAGMISAASAAGSPAITVWGDSLTIGNEAVAGTTYPRELAALARVPVNNLGISSQTSTQIAVRMGAIPTSVTAGFTIPTSGCAVPVAFPAGHEPAFAAIAGPKGYYTGKGVLGEIAGVKGYTIDDRQHQYIFTPLACPGAPVAVEAGTAWTPVLGDLLAGPQVIWAGRNDFNSPPAVLANIAAMVARLQSIGNSKYLILSVLNGDGLDVEWAGGKNYAKISAINSGLAQAYPGHFLDIRTALVAAYDPSQGEDVVDHGHDIPPASLRAEFKVENGSCRTTLAASMGPADMEFQVAAPGNLRPCRSIQIDRERIEIEQCTSATCAVYPGGRGWGGTAAAPHKAGAVITGWDYLHLNGAGYRLVAKSVYDALSRLNKS